ncbi:MAG: hypothetical protein ACRC33_09555, partial [Gemmataceae bacterium]
IVGVAVGTAVPHALFCVYVIGLACRTLDLPLRTYVRTVLPGPLTAAGVLTLVWLACGPAAGWAGLLAVGVVGGLTQLGLVAALEPSVRHRVRRATDVSRWFRAMRRCQGAGASSSSRSKV